jgi:hypothetical protein
MDLRSKTTALFTDLIFLNMTETKGSYAHFIPILPSSSEDHEELAVDCESCRAQAQIGCHPIRKLLLLFILGTPHSTQPLLTRQCARPRYQP